MGWVGGAQSFPEGWHPSKDLGLEKIRSRPIEYHSAIQKNVAVPTSLAGGNLRLMYRMRRGTC